MHTGTCFWVMLLGLALGGILSLAQQGQAPAPAPAPSFTTLKAPNAAKKSFEKAQKSLQQKPPKHAEAAKELEKAVQVYPEFAAAWNMLGECKLAAKDEEGARQAFEKSLAADGKYTNPYLQLAILDLRASRWKEAADITGRLNELNPYIAQAHYFNAIANFNLNKMELAEKAARNAMDRSDGGRFPRAHHLLGAILARQGNFSSAADEFRTYLKLSPNAAEADQLKRQLTEWEGLGVIQKAEAAPQAASTKQVRAVATAQTQATASRPKLPARVPSARSRSRDCESSHWIDSVAGDGKIIKLEDGSMWQVDDVDTVTTSIWLPVSQVVICGTKMINVDDEESVEVTPLSGTASSVTSPSSSSRRSYVVQAASNDETFVINGEVFKAKTYCFNFDKGDRVIFLAGSPLGACASAKLLNVRTQKVCDMWCE